MVAGVRFFVQRTPAYENSHYGLLSEMSYLRVIVKRQARYNDTLAGYKEGSLGIK